MIWGAKNEIGRLDSAVTQLSKTLVPIKIPANKMATVTFNEGAFVFIYAANTVTPIYFMSADPSIAPKLLAGESVPSGKITKNTQDKFSYNNTSSWTVTIYIIGTSVSYTIS